MGFVRRHARHCRTHLAWGGLGLTLLASYALAEQKQTSDNQPKAKASNQTPSPAASIAASSPTYNYSCHPSKDATDENLCIERDAVMASQEQAFWAKLTFGIGVLGTMAVGVSLHFSIAATRASTKSANAAIAAAEIADLNTKALLAQESSNVFLSLLQSDFAYSNVADRTLFPDVKYFFKNYGRTPAIIRNFKIAMMDEVSAAELPQDRATKYLEKNILAGGAETEWIFVRPVRPFSELDKSDLGLEEFFVFVHGQVIYDDVFGIERTRYFLFQYDWSLDRFIEMGGEKSNHQTQRQIPPTQA